MPFFELTLQTLNRQVALPLLDSSPLKNPHLLNAMYSQFASMMKTVVDEDMKDDLEGADDLKAMLLAECPALFSYFLQHLIQSKSLLQTCVLQQRLFQRLEVAVKQDLFSKGITTVPLSQLEAEKYKLLAKLIQASRDKDALEFVQYHTEIMREMFDIPNFEAKEFQEEMKKQFINFAASLSERHFNSAALKIVRDTEQYYFEELNILVQASGFEVISYDPLFNLPKGK